MERDPVSKTKREKRERKKERRISHTLDIDKGGVRGRISGDKNFRRSFYTSVLISDKANSE